MQASRALGILLAWTLFEFPTGLARPSEDSP